MDPGLSDEKLYPKPGDMVMAIPSGGRIARPAIVTMVHSVDCLNLFLIPDGTIDICLAEQKIRDYVFTSIVREDHAGEGNAAWRPMQEIRKEFT